VATTLPAVGAAAPSAAPAAVVGLAGQIDDYNRDSFFKRFKTAKADGAKTIIVEIDTWGGLVTAGLDISRFLKSQNDVHTIAYVNDRAISAGAMIAMACDEIVMKDEATLGDCAPIVRTSDGSLQPMPAAERAKMESPIAADFYESALRNHHDPLLAEAMVVTEVVVYWVEDTDTGERRFVNQADYNQLTTHGWTPVHMAGVPQPVDTADKLLTVGTDEAIKLGLATGKANTVEQLAADRNLIIIETLHSGFGEAMILWLNSGVVRMLLITIFGAAIYAALHAPGHGTAEALAVTTLGLLLGVPLLAGYATWWEILLILGGLAMVAFEIFVFPHAGVMILGGVLMMVVGLVMTFVGAEPGGYRIVPHLPANVASLKHGLGYVTAGLIGAALVCSWLSRYLPKMPYFNRLVLSGVSGNGGIVAEATTPAWPPIGSVGRAVTPLGPGGSAEFPNASGTDFRIFSVVSESGYLPAGSPVIVREVGGGRLVVQSTVA
jgi:membrane-bound serine protease (ClpP class)